MGAIYEADLALWAKEQADALRRRANNELDFDHLAEEIESLGSSERREIRSRLTVLLSHLLKWRYQPNHQSNSWRASIDEARGRIALILEDSPSLKAYPGEALAKAYRSALNDRDINYLDSRDVPQDCPWEIEQVMDPDFLP
jgi:hypothetical protein